MAMKARFSQPQLPVKTVAAGDKTYIFICLNETQGTESYPDMGEGQTTEAYYEYDYNEIVGPTDKLPLDDIQVNPENYLDYEYVLEDLDVDALIKRIEKLEQENADMNRIFEGVVNSESGIL